MTPEDGPDPEAMYEVVEGFASWRVPGIPSFVAATGKKYPGDHPAVVEHFRDGYFRLDPEDVLRRQNIEIIALLRGAVPAVGAPGSGSVMPKRPPGRPKLTEGRVRADLERALASLRAEGKMHPSWDALAAAHDGLSEFGLTVDALNKRRTRFPDVFRELVPDLGE
jgi:hypothetical protein